MLFVTHGPVFLTQLIGRCPQTWASTRVSGVCKALVHTDPRRSAKLCQCWEEPTQPVWPGSSTS